MLQPQITPHIHDSTIVAWSLGNEYSEIVTGQEIENILDSPTPSPAKHALVDFVLSDLYGGNVANMESAWSVQGISPQPTVNDLYSSPLSAVPDQDLEQMRRFYVDSYYALIENTVKSIDPNHLYAGFWILPGDWENESDWFLMAKHCDVIGFDSYRPHFDDPAIVQLIKEADKPVMCGEFSFPQDDPDRGFSSFSAAHTATEAKSGKLYEQYVGEAARNPYCVGVNWFQYRDEPVTGRGPGHGPDLVYGENYAFGLVDIADQPKWDLVKAVRMMNLSIPKIRESIR